MPNPPSDLRRFESLTHIVKCLRGPEGCPWDKEQTHQSLTRFAIEEAHEFAEAADRGDNKAMCEELGDMLLQVVLNAEIARQSGAFDIGDVIGAIAEKMIRRHPHVFAESKAKDSEEVLQNWEKIKATEKKKAVFDIPESVPALIRAHKIGDKTQRLKFDWDNTDEVMRKVEEEVGELQEALKDGSRAEIEHEIGDVLFSTAQLARHAGLDAEQALRGCNRRFEWRFQTMQELISKAGKEWSKLQPSEKEYFYREAKKLEKSQP